MLRQGSEMTTIKNALPLIVVFMLGYFLGTYDLFPVQWHSQIRARAINYISREYKKDSTNIIPYKHVESMKNAYFETRDLSCISFEPRDGIFHLVYGPSMYYCENRVGKVYVGQR